MSLLFIALYSFVDEAYEHRCRGFNQYPSKDTGREDMYRERSRLTSTSVHDSQHPDRFARVSKGAEKGSSGFDLK